MDFVRAREILKVIEELDNNSKETILKALNLAEHVEKNSKLFYEKEKKKNIGNELEAFFDFMIREEEMHLNKILELKKNLENNQELSEINFWKNAAPEINNIPGGKEEMTALLYALWREKKAVDFYESASKKTSGIVKKFFEELSNFEKTHVNLLEEYVELMNNSDELIMG